MEPFITKDFTGAPFELFGPAHLTALGLVFLFNLSFLALRGRITPRASRTLRIVMACCMIVVEIAWHLWNLYIGEWTVQTMLPFHLCSMFVMLNAAMLITGSYGLYEFAYLLGIAGALQALLTPDAGKYGFPHFRFFQVIISHGLIVSSAVYMTVVEKYRPTWASVRRVLVGGNLYMLAVGLVNWLLGSNYLFIAHKPPTASLLDVLPPWPWYIAFIELLGVIFCVVLYLPFALGDLKKRPQPATPAGT